MYSIQLNIQDSVVDKLFYFLDNLPSQDVQVVSKINLSQKDQHQENLSDELISRIDDIKNNTVKTLSRDELFDGV